MLTAQQAATVVLANLNDTGAPGADIYSGGGLVDLGRVMRRNERGIIDAAVAGVVVSPDGASLLVTVQNRGTSNLVNTAVAVTTPAGDYPMNVTTLAPGGIYTFRVPTTTSGYVTSRVTTAGADAFPANNKRTDVLQAK
jgi:secreted PhoX family phosphatase